MNAVISLISTIITIYTWVIILHVVLSWLVVFNVVNTRNRAIYTIGDVLHKLTEPVLGPIRRILPNLGGIDISPLVLLLLLIFVQNLLLDDLRPALSGY
jgi:YggT family protein